MYVLFICVTCLEYVYIVYMCNVPHKKTPPIDVPTFINVSIYPTLYYFNFNFIYHHNGEQKGLSSQMRYVCRHTRVLFISVTCLKTSLQNRICMFVSKCIVYMCNVPRICMYCLYVLFISVTCLTMSPHRNAYIQVYLPP